MEPDNLCEIDMADSLQRKVLGRKKTDDQLRLLAASVTPVQGLPLSLLAMRSDGENWEWVDEQRCIDLSNLPVAAGCTGGNVDDSVGSCSQNL